MKVVHRSFDVHGQLQLADQSPTKRPDQIGEAVGESRTESPGNHRVGLPPVQDVRNDVRGAAQSHQPRGSSLVAIIHTRQRPGYKGVRKQENQCQNKELISHSYPETSCKQCHQADTKRAPEHGSVNGCHSVRIHRQFANRLPRKQIFRYIPRIEFPKAFEFRAASNSIIP